MVFSFQGVLGSVPSQTLEVEVASGPVAVATADGSGCGLVTFTLHGRSAPALIDGPQPLARLESLLRTRF